jgi:hypothetical protein
MTTGQSIALAAALIALALLGIGVLHAVQTARQQSARAAWMEAAATNDPLLRLVETWRQEYASFEGRSKAKYYAFTAIALVSTSLVTAIAGVGGWIGDNAEPSHPRLFLVITATLGFIATVTTGLERLFNDRKDFIRSARYGTLFEIEILKYIYSRAPSAATPAQAALVDAVAKLRSAELSDWIQDETSATVEIGSSSQSDLDLLRARAVAYDAHSRERQASDTLNAAQQQADDARRDYERAAAQYQDALNTKADATTINRLKQEQDAAKIAQDDKTAALTRAQSAQASASKAVEDAEADVVRLQGATPRSDGVRSDGVPQQETPKKP